jgi:hypothetical protein
MELFDVVKKIFDKKESSWLSVSKMDKIRNFFMINRIMSIQFPVQANQFNKTKITPNRVIDWWHDNLSPRFTGPPKWIYTKTKKKEKETKKDTPSKNLNLEESESFIREKFCVSKRDLEQIKKFYPERYNSWISSISSQLGVRG